MLAIREEGWYTIKVFSDFIETWNAVFWGGPVVVLIFLTGIAVTIVCGFPQIRFLPRAIRAFWRNMTGQNRSGGSSYRALCTALAATVGTGNIAGVAGAVAIGGPGAVFWLWLSAFLGMATKFAESTLAVRFSARDSAGKPLGGTMYMICGALSRRWQPMARFYCILGLAAAFGVGNTTQVNAVISALNGAGEQYGFSVTPVTCAVIGLVLGLAVFVLVSGGAEKIGAAAECLVPVAAGAYMFVCLAALWLRRDALPGAIQAILYGAFSPKAVTGGAVGSFLQTLRIGVSRGVFTNEAGMGTAAMSHAGAKVAHPVDQGLMGIMEVFLDTIVMCTLTALVILTSGVPIPYGEDAGAELTARALSVGLGPWVSAFLCACLCLFALATILGWGLYAGRCAEFLLGRMNWRVFASGQAVCVLLGSVLDQGLIWNLSEFLNGLMALPNLITLMLLLPILRRLTIDYPIHKLRGSSAAGGTYENFHQCKPLPAFSHEKVPPLRRGS